MAGKKQMPVEKTTAGVDEASKGIIYEGATLSQLCELFSMDFRTLTRRLRRSDVKPCGKRNTYDIYHVREVAPWVLPPKMDIEEYIKNMHPNDLPKMLTKEYWAGLTSRQAYLRREGELWSTDEIQSAFAEIVQILIMNSRVIEDEVDRKAELTLRQRALVKESIDQLIDSCRDKLMSHFIGRRKKTLEAAENTLPGMDEELNHDDEEL